MFQTANEKHAATGRQSLPVAACFSLGSGCPILLQQFAMSCQPDVGVSACKPAAYAHGTTTMSKLVAGPFAATLSRPVPALVLALIFQSHRQNPVPSAIFFPSPSAVDTTPFGST